MFEDTRAFAPMYDQTVAVEGLRQGRTLRGQYRACVFDNGLADPLADVDTASGRRSVSIAIPRRGDESWICGRPQVGDVVRIVGEAASFRVFRVSLPMGSDWMVEAREA